MTSLSEQPQAEFSLEEVYEKLGTIVQGAFTESARPEMRLEASKGFIGFIDLLLSRVPDLSSPELQKLAEAVKANLVQLGPRGRLLLTHPEHVRKLYELAEALGRAQGRLEIGQNTQELTGTSGLMRRERNRMDSVLGKSMITTEKTEDKS